MMITSSTSFRRRAPVISINTQGIIQKNRTYEYPKNKGAAGTAAMREPCLAVALMNQGRCLSKSKDWSRPAHIKL